MNHQQPSQNADEPPAASGGQPATSPPAPRRPLPSDRTRQAFWGGMVAGIGIAISLAVVMHVIQQLSPGNPPCSGYGCSGNSIGWSVLLVLILGLIIGLGLGIGLAAAVPDKAADPAAPHHATPTDQAPVPSA